MVGSADSIACTNIMLNTAVAESLRIYADRLEDAADFESALHEMIQKTIKDHKRIIFNGNGYDDEWIKEATEKRGLLNYRTTPDALPHLLDKKNVELLMTHKIYTEAEIRSRFEITLDNYCKTVVIEANTMADIAKMQILPAVEKYVSDVSRAALAKKELDPMLECVYEMTIIRRLSALTDCIALKVGELEDSLIRLDDAKDVQEESEMIRDDLLVKMNELRVACDEAETLTAKNYWPFPKYGDLLFGVR